MPLAARAHPEPSVGSAAREGAQVTGGVSVERSKRLALPLFWTRSQPGPAFLKVSWCGRRGYCSWHSGETWGGGPAGLAGGRTRALVVNLGSGFGSLNLWAGQGGEVFFLVSILQV